MVCAECKVDKDVSEFHFKNREKNRRYSWCKPCRRLKDQERGALRLEIIWKFKDVPCKDCGVKYPPWIMQFDHIDDNKEANVASIKNTDELIAEIAKCEVVCANCHAERTHQRRDSLASSKRVIMACRACRENESRCKCKRRREEDVYTSILNDSMAIATTLGAFDNSPAPSSYESPSSDFGSSFDGGSSGGAGGGPDW